MASANGRLYEQVAESLRRRIEHGEFSPGDSIPTETELQEKHGVSRDTVRRALTQLTQEGLISGRQGRARYVRSYKPLAWSLSGFEKQSNHSPEADAWSTEVKRQKRMPSESIEVGIEVAAGRVAELLRLHEGKDLVVVRRRVRFVDSIPYQLADSYFPEALVRGTPLMAPRSVSVAGGVLASIGHPQLKLVDEIAVRMPTNEESSRLEIAAGTPIAEVTRIGFAADGAALRMMVTVAPGDRHILRYELDAA